MQTESGVTIAEMAAGSLAAVRVFERLGIDYCCGGKRLLEDVCREKGLDFGTVQKELTAAGVATPGGDRDWAKAPLRELVAHVVNVHHAYLKRELHPISERVAKVYRVYNERYGPTLQGLPEVYSGLRAEMETHMFKEERMLFPAIIDIENAVNQGAPLPKPAFGSVANPIATMEHEHDSSGDALKRIREITKNFEIPDYACTTFRALMAGLKELEQDMHVHIHLENNIMFPRAIELERAHS